MGHKRLSSGLPNTAPWRRVVGHIADGDTIPVIAGATTIAATAGLDQATGDAGYLETVFLLSKLALAARDGDFTGKLREAGLDVPPDPGVFELTVAVSDAVEGRMRATHRPSDIGEMARLAAVESLTSLLGNETPNLFDVSAADVQEATRGFSTVAGFSRLFHDFYGRFANRFLGYHLGRELSHHVGGNGRFPDTAAHTAFNRELAQHCSEAALIVKTYAGEWLSKQNFLSGITRQKATKFGDHCLDKLRAELLLRGAAS